MPTSNVISVYHFLKSQTPLNIYLLNYLLLTGRMNEFEKVFGRNAQLIVLEHLLLTRGTTTYLSGIAEETGLSHSSVARVIEPFLELNIVKELKLGKQIRTFVLNENNETTKLLIQFHEDLSKLFTV
ncbi:hypothetical protein C5S39_00885 [Candidatus Methanophagaceae archaeon]|nr:hypothetical protein C5S39_00885 [Methanophagales archaeon]